MPNCNDIREQLKAYADNELTAAAERGVREHVETCRDCREELEEIHTLTRTLTSVMWETPSPALRARILASLPPEKQSAKHWLGGWRTNGWMLASGAAAAIVLIFVFTSPKNTKETADLSARVAAGSPATVGGAVSSSSSAAKSTLRDGEGGESKPKMKVATGTRDELEEMAKTKGRGARAASPSMNAPVTVPPAVGLRSHAGIPLTTNPMFDASVSKEAQKSSNLTDSPAKTHERDYGAIGIDRTKTTLGTSPQTAPGVESLAGKAAAKPTAGKPTTNAMSVVDGLRVNEQRAMNREPAGKAGPPDVASNMASGANSLAYRAGKAAESTRGLALGVTTPDASRLYSQNGFAAQQPPVVFFVEKLEEQTKEAMKQIRAAGGTVDAPQTIRLEDGGRVNDFYAYIPQKDAEELVNRLQKIESPSVRGEANQYRAALTQLPEVQAYNSSFGMNMQNGGQGGGLGGGGGRGGIARGGGGFGGGGGLGAGGMGGGTGGGVGGPGGAPGAPGGTQQREAQGGIAGQSQQNVPSQNPGSPGGPTQNGAQFRYQGDRNTGRGSGTKYGNSVQSEDKVRLNEQLKSEVRDQDTRVLNMMRKGVNEAGHALSENSPRSGMLNDLASADAKNKKDENLTARRNAAASKQSPNRARTDVLNRNEAADRAKLKRQSANWQYSEKEAMAKQLKNFGTDEQLRQITPNLQQSYGRGAKPYGDTATNIAPSGMVMVRFQLREPTRPALAVPGAGAKAPVKPKRNE
jgi:hypothetical protein